MDNERNSKSKNTTLEQDYRKPRVRGTVGGIGRVQDPRGKGAPRSSQSHFWARGTQNTPSSMARASQRIKGESIRILKAAAWKMIGRDKILDPPPLKFTC